MSSVQETVQVTGTY